ncbi:MAG: choice-of-anchor D domain-containing protein, partial [Candidatus Accumulibacter sp.]|nr:choice-of-anchor D domain-containing protein [Accumulibacter sp.]
SQDVTVSGAVYRLANPLLNTTALSLAARVGDAAPSAAISVSNSSPDSYTEGLKVSTGSAPAGFSNSGSIANLVAGGTDASSVKVALDTATAGIFNGTQTLDFVSTGAGTTGAADIGVGNGNVAVSGKVYTPAVATLNTTNVNFGIVHVGDTVSQAISVSNTAPVSALNDVLRGEFSSASASFSGGGTLGAGIDAGATDNSRLSVGMATTTAGNLSGSASFSMRSHDVDLSDQALADLTVGLSGTVNNYASSIFTFGSGAGHFSGSGNSFELDFGTQLVGSGALTSTLFAGNGAIGPADLLDGDFSFLDTIDFVQAGFGPFFNLGAGDLSSALLLAFNTSNVGDYIDTILLSGFGHNASGYRDAVADVTLTVRGRVIQGGGDVPEPGTLWLATLALLAIGRRAIRRTLGRAG